MTSENEGYGTTTIEQTEPTTEDSLLSRVAMELVIMSAFGVGVMVGVAL